MGRASGAEVVTDVLREYGALTRQALARYLPSKEPRRYLYDLVADYPNRGGKMMRPSICLATTRALGGQVEDAVRSAASIELLHNALLVHDDIEDESTERRGAPTMHAMNGVPLAINVGDMLTLLSLRPLLDNYYDLGPELTFRLVQEAELVAAESAEGQALELGWRHHNTLDVTESDYLQMVLKKTCWLGAIYPIRIGALIGTRAQIELDRFTSFGFFLGAAFQIQDDLLNLVADTRYGKEKAGDLWEGKRTLMLIHLLENCTAAERKKIKRTLATPRGEKRRKDIKFIRTAMERHGSVEHARMVANGIAGAAIEEFNQAFRGVPYSRDLEFLERLSVWVFERT